MSSFHFDFPFVNVDYKATCDVCHFDRHRKQPSKFSFAREITKGRNYVPSPKTYYMEENAQSTNNTCDYAQENALMRFLGMSHAPRAWKITLRLP